MKLKSRRVTSVINSMVTEGWVEAIAETHQTSKLNDGFRYRFSATAPCPWQKRISGILESSWLKVYKSGKIKDGLFRKNSKMPLN